MSYVSYFNFYVYLKPFATKNLDTVNDKIITLKELRQLSNEKDKR